MKKKFLATIALFLAISLVMTVNASYSLNEGVNGHVSVNGLPAEGIPVRVYNITSGMLEGYGVDYTTTPATKGMLGTDITDENGYFHIAWLYGHNAEYKIVAETPAGNIIQFFYVQCEATVPVGFSYSTDGDPCTPGYWKNHPDEWPIDAVIIGGVSYTKTQAIPLLKGNAKDATYKLASHLIAAKLNLANGVSASQTVLDAIDDADAFLTANPLGSDPKGADRNDALSLKDTLDAFNNS